MIKIDGWLGDTQWDVIHFNWGVWDMYGWQYATDDNVHFSAEGSGLMAKQVADCILKNRGSERHVDGAAAGTAPNTDSKSKP